MSINTNNDRTILCHLSLEHIRLKRLKELDNQWKKTRASFKRSIHKSKDKLGYIHSDLWGSTQ